MTTLVIFYVTRPLLLVAGPLFRTSCTVRPSSQKHDMNDEEHVPPHRSSDSVHVCACRASSSSQQKRKSSAELLRASSNSRRGDRWKKSTSNDRVRCEAITHCFRALWCPRESAKLSHLRERNERLSSRDFQLYHPARAHRLRNGHERPARRQSAHLQIGNEQTHRGVKPQPAFVCKSCHDRRSCRRHLLQS